MRNQCRVSAETQTGDCVPDSSLYDDLLISAPALAVYLLGDARRARSIYRLKSKGWPIFRIGRELAARKSALKEFIAREERRVCA